MPHDDLGQFPSPIDSPITTPDTPPVPAAAPPTFEETPDEIPSAAPVFSEPAPTPASPPPTPVVYPEPVSEPISAIPATVPVTPKGGSAFGPLLALLLLLITGGALAVTVFLFSQSQQLKQQLSEVTQTLEQQRTTITPSPTPTNIDFPTPSITPEATESALATASAAITPATSSASTALPLAGASKALKVAINHLPNAQLIIIKTENATNPSLTTSKYFFRQDLTTKKYFYVLISGQNNPEVVDKAIYVTPDNSIPSLNDLVLGNALGIDLDEAIKIAGNVCSSHLCATAMVKAQYIKSGNTLIWQLTFDPADATKSDLIIQLNAVTKEVLYKSTGF